MTTLPAVPAPTFVPAAGPIDLARFAARHPPRAELWADDFVLARELIGAAERGRMFRAVRAGQLVRIRAGVHLPALLWNGLDGDEQYLMRIRAAALAADRPLVFASASGAALWRLPTLNRWPTAPTVLGVRAGGGRSSKLLRVNNDGVPREVWVVDGLATTSLARTVVDVARRTPFADAVAMADRALAAVVRGARGVDSVRVDKIELTAELMRLELGQGVGRVVEVVEFADGLSGSVGESLTRIVVVRLGFPAPLLQFEFRDYLGKMFVDFWWPHLRLIGEFDGRGKYLREEFTQGRTAAQVVIAEKDRENRLRALGNSMVRFDWADANSPPSMRRKLFAAGLELAR